MQREWWLTSLLRSAVPAGLLAVVAPFAPAILEWASARMGIHLALAAVALARLSHSAWRVELSGRLMRRASLPGARGGGRDSGWGRLGTFAVLFVGGRIGRSQAAACRNRVLAAAKR